MTKHIFVTGGVVSGLGKGITAASLGRLLKARGLRVSVLKLDPYINIDPGTMSPYQHGEVFVTEDGAETDLDLGHYERFIDEEMTRFSNLTTGKVYWNVLQRERDGGYSGQTVQVIPHITREIIDFIQEGAKEAHSDIAITEIGGTVGDIECQPFLEAIRQLRLEIGRENCLFLHVTLVPYLASSHEHKSKPTQHSVQQLQSMGITPDVIVARTEQGLEPGIIDKIALFCNVHPSHVIENMTLPCLYEAPIMLHENGLDQAVCRHFQLETPVPDLTGWRAMLSTVQARYKRVTVALAGKYVRLHDAYLSVVEALAHSGYECGAHIDIRWVDSEDLSPLNVSERLAGVHGILVPGGFGDRGVEGMVVACRYARENNIPYLGLCLGMQIAVIEFARHVCGLENAHSTEFDTGTPYPVIDFMPGQKGQELTGGTMRLGAYPCCVREGTRLREVYGQEQISERHRHRYEFNNDYRQQLEESGMRVGGVSPDGSIVETVELSEHKFFVGVQFHPEFKSRPGRAHPLFRAFVTAALGN